MRRALANAANTVLPESIVAILAVVRRHKRETGAFPNLLRPTTFNEKLIHRMLFDHRPIWTQLQDKLAAREYVKARIGAEPLTQLYWVTADPANIPFDELPDSFVTKPNHTPGASRWYQTKHN